MEELVRVVLSAFKNCKKFTIHIDNILEDHVVLQSCDIDACEILTHFNGMLFILKDSNLLLIPFNSIVTLSIITTKEDLRYSWEQYF